NVFSLVECFTFHPSLNETPPPEIQYRAGIVLRNTCRRDESRGVIRQHANMPWEMYPREFAKSRRCRKVKYCGNECQSQMWA
ncbi:hypothetical protein K439DRAFT_1368756, partial [Ramaria rubella]